MKHYGRTPSSTSIILHKTLSAHSLIVNYFIGSLGSLEINQQLIKWTSSSKLLGVTIDNKLTWTNHISERKRRFVSKLNLIKRSRLLSRNSLLDLYFKIISPSVTYALPIWECCTNKNEINSLESIHYRLFELYITSRATRLLWM